MPIFEYVCRDCQRRFETLVTGTRQPSCPACHSASLEKQISTFAVSTAAPRASVSPAGGCGSCGDPRGPGACSMN